MKKVVSFATMLLIALTVCRADDERTALNMFNVKHGSTLLDSWIYLDAQNNFAGASFAPAGELTGFEDTIVIHANGWTNKIAATPETAIIAYIKGVYYWIYVKEHIVRNNETVKTTKRHAVEFKGKDKKVKTTDSIAETKRSSEIFGMQIEYRRLLNVKTERAASVNPQKPGIFISYDNNNLMINKIKTKLTKSGCTFTQNAPISDFQLYITATERQFNRDRDFVYCYLDVTLELFNTSAGESIYVDDFSLKGVSTSRDRAVRAAIDDAVEAVGEKIMPLIIKNKEQ